ncbi:unnamed protein product [Brachionus calyciflorus]|uniref:Uncharacterized protein n=1 Tax=Brachionus calyciflorus TaxID=104777 RepID=A0A813NSX0_9BILA|nr:unnamed protein product [Brachionus calyciflorus]
MISIYSCNQNQLCNAQMLVEDFSNAIYWRIAAIFSTIAALFSVAVVFWFLIFRDNPDLPDDTDSLEKEKFLKGSNHKKTNNLLEEIIEALKNIFNSKSGQKSKLMKKMEYLIFGSSSENFSESEKSNSQVAESIMSVNENDAAKTRKFTRYKNTKKIEETKKDKDKDQEKDKIKDKDKTKSNKKTDKPKSKNNNNINTSSSLSLFDQNYFSKNRNNNRKSFSEYKINKVLGDLNKSSSLGNVKVNNKINLFNGKSKKIELDDFLLEELNNNFSYFLNINYADAYLSLKYFKSKHFILIIFDSIDNLTDFDLKNVLIIVDVFYKKKHMKRMFSKSDAFSLTPNERKPFNFKFLINLTRKIQINLIKLNIFIIGKVIQNGLTKLNSSNLIIASKSAPEMQILGGAQIKIKDIIQNIIEY